MPEKLKRAWLLWKAFGQAIGDFVARVGLSIFYFTIFVPFGVAARLSGNLLGPRDSAKASYWQPRPAREAKVSDAQKQF